MSLSYILSYFNFLSFVWRWPQHDVAKFCAKEVGLADSAMALKRKHLNKENPTKAECLCDKSP